MPWRGPEVPGEFPTLGHAVAELIQSACAIPDGEHMGEPFVLTDEQYRCLLHHYRLDPETGAFVHFRGTQLTRPQKWGKGPFAAAFICAEAHPEAPVLFAGWDAQGEPVGKPWPSPHIQVTAVSEDQTDNVFRALLPMIRLGALSADLPDTGLTRVNLPSGGLIEPVTAAALSRLGQRVTFVVQDQTESWFKTNGGHKLADNQRRGLAGMKGRFLSTPNAWDPAEDSVAQRTGESASPGVYHDDVNPGAGSVRNKADRRRMLKRVYGDAATKPRPDAEWEPWIDLDRIDGEIVALMEHDPSQAERFFLNRKEASESAAFDHAAWKRLVAPDHVVPDEAVITIGVDGARYRDALAIVGTEVETAHQWVLGVWESPEHPRPDYEHPFRDIDGVMQDAFDRWTVARCYVDPQWIDSLLDLWQGRWGDKRVVKWQTNRPAQMAWAVRNYTLAIGVPASDDDPDSGRSELTHDGNPVFSQHIRNARRQKVNVYDDRGRQMHILSKDRPDSPRRKDVADAAVLSFEARGDAIADGVEPMEPFVTWVG